jgi:tetratricopeptide (TPR) repeat protein
MGTQLYEQALSAFRAGETENTRVFSQQLVERARAEGDVRGEIDGLCMLARVALREGDFERTRDLAVQAHVRARGLGDLEALQMPLHLCATAARAGGDGASARRLYLESIELNRRLDDSLAAAELHNLGHVELHAGNLERAKELFAEALAEARARSFDGLLPYLVLDRGVIAVEEGDAETGVRILACGQAAFDARGELVDPDDVAEVDRALEKARGALDPAMFARAEAEGRELSVQDALA